MPNHKRDRYCKAKVNGSRVEPGRSGFRPQETLSSAVPMTSLSGAISHEAGSTSNAMRNKASRM